MDQKDDFSRLAKAKSILSDKRLAECVAAWEEKGAEASGQKIWDLAFDMGYITSKAHTVISEHMNFIEMREEDKRLGELSAKNGIVNPAELEVALILQRKNHKDKKEIKRLEQILAEMGALLPFQLDAFRKGVAVPLPPQAAKTPPPLPAAPKPAAESPKPQPAKAPAAGVGEQVTLMRHDGSGRIPLEAEPAPAPAELPELSPMEEDMPPHEARPTDIVHFQQPPQAGKDAEPLEELEPEQAPPAAEARGTTVVTPAPSAAAMCDRTLDLGDLHTAGEDDASAATVPPTPARAADPSELTLDMGSPAGADDTLVAPKGLRSKVPEGERPELDLDGAAAPAAGSATLFVPENEKDDDLTDFSDVIPDMEEVGNHPFVDNPTDLDSMSEKDRKHFLDEEGTYMGMDAKAMEEEKKPDPPKEEKKKKKGWFGRG